MVKQPKRPDQSRQTGVSKGPGDRRARLEAALRENLKRRKRGKTGQAETDAPLAGEGADRSDGDGDDGER